MIDEYKRENDKCSKKIQELQEKLHSTSNKYVHVILNMVRFQKEREEDNKTSARYASSGNNSARYGGYNS